MIIGLIVNVGVSFHVFLLITSYRHVRIQLAENPIRLPVNMSFGDTTNPTTWSGTGGQSLGHPIVLSAIESEDESKLSLNSLYCVHLGSADEQR